MDGTGETLSSPLLPGIDQSRSQSQCQGKVNGLTAPGIAKKLKASPVEDVEGVASMTL